MSVETVYLARHGETEWNVTGRRQGRADSPLTPRGLKDAEQLADFMRDSGVDLVATSPLPRAKATAAIVAAVLDVPIIEVTELAETDFGDLTGLTTAQVEEQFPGVLEERQQDLYQWRYPGGESYEDVHHRSQVALSVIAAFLPKRVLIVSHEMIGRMLLKSLLALSADDALRTVQRHDVVYRVDVGTKSVERISTRGDRLVPADYLR